MSGQIIDDCIQKMESTISVLHREIVGVRTGRASAALAEGIKVDYYGTPTPIKQMATIATPEPRTITIQPWDASQLKAIEKAVFNSDLGITPANDGKIIRLAIPLLTEERRKELTRLVKKMGEENKIAVRNVRREAMERIKKCLKNKEISEDDERKVEEKIQKITDDFIERIDSTIANKEKEIMEI